MSKEKSIDSVEKDNLVITALLTEYQVLHTRVSSQVSSYDSNLIKLFTLYGALLFFGGSNFNSTDELMILYIDVLFLVVFPVLAIILLLTTSAHLKKVMLIGHLLKSIENKINVVLKESAIKYEYIAGRTMSWEFYRMNDGHASKQHVLVDITFSTCIVVVLTIVSVIAPFLRLRLIPKIPIMKSVHYLFFAFLVIIIYSFITTLKLRKTSLKISQNERKGLIEENGQEEDNTDNRNSE